MKKGGKGGANTKTGREFEGKRNILKFFRGMPGYEIRANGKESGNDIFFHGKLVAKCFYQDNVYTYLAQKGVVRKQGKHLRPRRKPDNALLVITNDKLFILEIKFQERGGSVDLKLAACDYLKRYYVELVRPIGLKVEFIYILANWFDTPKYQDLLKYIKSVDCRYVFDELPLSQLGLPSEGDEGKLVFEE